MKIFLIICLVAKFFYLSIQHSSHKKLILISLDGFRYDYIDKVKAKRGADKIPNFLNLIEEGVFVKDGVYNSYTTKTFPNHWTIVTGMHEESHGVVGNNIFDPRLNITQSMTTKHIDDFWFNNGTKDRGGEPIWVTNQKNNGGASGVIYWPGVYSKIHGHKPTKYRKYDNALSNGTNEQIDLLVEWFLGEDCPINLGVLYCRQPDGIGHKFGPDSEEILDEVMKLDSFIGYLTTRLKNTKLYGEINLIITSDHGMSAASKENVIVLNDVLKPETYTISGSSPVLHINPSNGVTVENLYESLKTHKLSQYMNIYKREDIPKEYFYKHNVRIGPIIVSAHDTWNIVQTNEQKNNWTQKGDHGYNNSNTDMHPFLIAKGPAFKTNYTITSIHNVDIYNLMCEILEIPPYPNNGSLNRVSKMLKKNISFFTTTFVTLSVSIAFTALFSAVFSLAACRVYRIQTKRKYGMGYQVSLNGLPMNDTEKNVGLLDMEETEEELP